MSVDMLPSDRFCRVFHAVHELPENVFLRLVGRDSEMFSALLAPVILCQLMWSLILLPWSVVHSIYDHIQLYHSGRNEFRCYTGTPI